MKRMIWLSDLHISEMHDDKVQQFLETLESYNSDFIAITGDTGNGSESLSYLQTIAEYTQKNVFFILGNHDFYRDKIEVIRQKATSIAAEHPLLCYLTTQNIIELSPDTALIGHDGWYDGRCPDFVSSKYHCYDFEYITDFIGLSDMQRLMLIQKLADEATEHCSKLLELAFEKYDRVVLMTHVPPFIEACRHHHHRLDINEAPYFVNYNFGQALAHIMNTYHDKHLEVIAGHTHGHHNVSIKPNLTISVAGRANDKTPIKQGTITF